MSNSFLVLPHVKDNPDIDPYDIYAYADSVLRLFQTHGVGEVERAKEEFLAEKLISQMSSTSFDRLENDLLKAFNQRRVCE